MSGRKYFDRGETFQYDILSVCSHAERPGGKQLFREKFIIRPEMHPPSTLGAMNGYDVFANVIVLTPPEHADGIYERTEAFIDRGRRLAAGITRLPNEAGLLYKVLGEGDGTRERNSSANSAPRSGRKSRANLCPKSFPWR